MGKVSVSTEKNMALVRRAVADTWNGLDLDLADILFCSGYINHGGLIPNLVSGPESIKAPLSSSTPRSRASRFGSEA